MSEWELLNTLKGRRWLERWCDLTRFEADAEFWRKRLADAREKVADKDLEE